MLPIILISGWAVKEESLLPLHDELSKTASVHTVSLHDLPRFRKTVGDDDRISAYASGLLGYSQNLEGRCIVAGWSTGATVALEAAIYNQDQIAGIVMMNGTARFCTDTSYDCGRSEVVLRSMAQALSRDRQAVLAGFFTGLFSPFVPDDDEMTRCVEAALQIDLRDLKTGLQYLQNVDLRDRLRTITLPALIIHGREDAIIPLGAGRYLADNMGKNEFVICDHVGHDLPLRYPGRVTQNIVAFSERTCHDDGKARH